MARISALDLEQRFSVEAVLGRHEKKKKGKVEEAGNGDGAFW